MFGTLAFADKAFGDAPTETIIKPIFEDAWHQPLSVPVRRRDPFPTGAQQFAAFVEAAPFPEAVSADRWFRQLAEPVQQLRSGLRAHVQPFAFFVKADPFPEAVSADRWFRPFAEPVRIRPPTPIGAYPFAFLVKADPFPSASEDRWMPPLSQPVRVKPPTPVGAYPFAFFVKASPFVESVTADRWMPPLSQPVRVRPPLPIAAYPFSDFRSFWPVILDEGQVSMVGIAQLSALPTSNVLTILQDRHNRLIYAVEVQLWALSDRS